MWDKQGAQVAFNHGPKRAHSCTLWLGRHGTISGLMDMPQVSMSTAGHQFACLPGHRLTCCSDLPLPAQACD